MLHESLKTLHPNHSDQVRKKPPSEIPLEGGETTLEIEKSHEYQGWKKGISFQRWYFFEISSVKIQRCNLGTLGLSAFPVAAKGNNPAGDYYQEGGQPKV